MSMLQVGALIGAGAITAAHALSSAVYHERVKAGRQDYRDAVGRATNRPHVSVVCTLCGLEQFSREAMDSLVSLDYPDYQVIFCVEDPADQAGVEAEEAAAMHPWVDAVVLRGRGPDHNNPKMRNARKGIEKAPRGLVLLVDSGVVAPKTFIWDMLEVMENDPRVGLVAAPPLGTQPTGTFGRLEHAFLNTFQGKWQYAADAIGYGFAQGKAMLFHRNLFDELWLFTSLPQCSPAEDAAATSVVRDLGLKVALARPSPTPIGLRTLADVVNRQVRWAILRHASFPGMYALEPLAWPVTAAFLYGAALGSPWAGLVAYELLAAAEAVLAVCVSTSILDRTPIAFFHFFESIQLRELVNPYVWLSGLFRSRFSWRGNEDRA